MPVVMVDNAIWLLGAGSSLYLTNPELAEPTRGRATALGRTETVRALIRSRADVRDADEQREAIDALVEDLDRVRLSI